MIASRLLSAAAAASLVLAPAAFADDAASSASSSSSESSSSSMDARTRIRVERCKRFSKGDDYERCVRLIRRLPERGSSSSASSSSRPAGDDEWKWTNIFNRLEEKLGSTVKFVSVMGKQFCKDRTDDSTATSRECMTRLGDELKTRMNALIDEAFRGDLPSAR